MASLIPTLTELRINALNKHYFVLIQLDPDYQGNNLIEGIKTSRVFITDANKIWMSDSEIVFNPIERIAGTPKSLVLILTQQGTPEYIIQNILDNVISSKYDLYENQEELYVQELNSYTNWKRSVLNTNLMSQGSKLSNLITALNPNAKDITSTSQVQTTIKRGGPRISLQERMMSLKQGEVLDVTSIKPDGTGVTTIQFTNRTRKVGSSNLWKGLPIVTSNIASYIIAMNLLPGGEGAHAQDILETHQALQGKNRGTVLSGQSFSPSQQLLQTTIQPMVNTLPTVIPSGDQTLVTGIPAQRNENIPIYPTKPIYNKTQWRKLQQQQNPSAFQQPSTIFQQQNPSAFQQQNPSTFQQQNPSAFQQPSTIFQQQNLSTFQQPNSTMFQQQNPSTFQQPPTTFVVDPQTVVNTIIDDRHTDSNGIYFFSNNKQYRELSNYYIRPDGQPLFTIDDVQFLSSEHAYQFYKFFYEGANQDTLNYAEIIRTANTPNKAKQLGGQKSNNRFGAPDPAITEYKQKAVMNPNWDTIKLDVMYYILQHKFTQDLHSKEVLLSTIGRNLYEDSPYDSYWGIGRDGKGDNFLGQILMKIRDELTANM